MKHSIRVRTPGLRFAVATALLVCSGCWFGGRNQDDTEVRLRTLFNEWVELAQHPDESLLGTRHLEILAEMLSMRPDAFLPVLDVFSNPDTPPKVRLLAHETLKAAVVMDKNGDLIVPALIPLTEPGHDPMVRACSIELLALTENPELVKTFSACLADENPRVRLAALCAQTRLGDDAARTELARLYRETSLSDAERIRVLLELIRRPAETELDIYREAALNVKLPNALRSVAVVALGSVGNETETQTLEAIVADTKLPEDLRSAAQGALEAIHARVKPSGN